MLGDSQVVVTGGAENMSNAPYALYDSRFGIKLGTDPVVSMESINCVCRCQCKV